MPEISSTPDLGALEIPMDAWTQPFWEAASRGELLLPRCADCRRFRWPPGPFCPRCQSQQTEWLPAGTARLFSYTITRTAGDGSLAYVPALVEFPHEDGIRLLASIVGTPLSTLQIGASLSLGWSQAKNAAVPVFSIPAGDDRAVSQAPQGPAPISGVAN